MSSWYVLSAMGIYSVTPGSDYYVIGSPRLEKASIQLENGNHFDIIAHKASAENKYIQSAFLNGEDFNRSYILHSEIINGGELEFYGPNPNKKWASLDSNLPVSKIEDHKIVSVPYVDKGDEHFLLEILLHLKLGIRVLQYFIP